MRIYTEESAVNDKEAALSFISLTPDRPAQPPTDQESSLTHFCAFLDFYTRHCQDPFSTSLACEKQAEVVEIAPKDVTPENLRLMMDTMLEVIDHLEKKWLDEQIRHEDRQRQHREDVARLHQQIWELQPEPRKHTHFHKRGLQWLSHILLRNSPSAKKAGKTRLSRHNPSSSQPIAVYSAPEQ